MLETSIKIVPSFSSLHNKSVVLFPVLREILLSILFEHSGLSGNVIYQVECLLLDYLEIILQSLDHIDIENVRNNGVTLCLKLIKVLLQRWSTHPRNLHGHTSLESKDIGEFKFDTTYLMGSCLKEDARLSNVWQF
jgi:hypothetical protein